MRAMGSSVLIMEAFVIGFAMLVAKDLNAHDGFPATLVGLIVVVGLILATGMLRKRAGLILGSVLQVGAISLGFAVTAMYFLGVVFAGLWATAIVVGKRVEAREAQLRGESL